MKKVAVIGTGKAGTAFAVELYGAGYVISGLADRNLSRAKKLGRAVKCRNISAEVSRGTLAGADIVIISVNDDSLGKTISDIASLINSKTHPVITHTSGIHSSLAFSRKKFNSKYVASFHPTQTIDSLSYKNKRYLTGIYFDIEGGPAALTELKKMISRLKSRSIIVKPEKKYEYHLSCVIASNFLNANYAVIEKLAGSIGVSKKSLVSALSILTDNTLKNIVRNGAGRSLTGPVERGDKDTVLKHIRLLYGKYPQFLEYYMNGSGILAGISKSKNRKKKSGLISILE